MTKRIRITFAAPVEFPGSIGQVFNLAPEETADGWTQAEQLSQSAADRAEAARRQGDMFPDCDLNQARPSAGQKAGEA